MRKIVLIVLGVFFIAGVGQAAEVTGHLAQKSDRCKVCGMMVAKYPSWLTEIELVDGTVLMFDGVKDMMVYYFSPEQYGGPAQLDGSRLIVKDYYSQKWIDGQKALYVVGSDLLGPMGHEFVSFETPEGADNFMIDHKGKEILTFTEIDSDRVESMRGGHKMGMKKMKSKKD